jgi:hypothetical protein
MRHGVLALLFLGAACSTTEWVRDDRNAEETDREIVDCRRHAQREASLRAEGFYGRPGYGPSGGAYTVRNRMLDEAHMTDLCMHSKGFRQQPKS